MTSNNVKDVVDKTIAAQEKQMKKIQKLGFEKRDYSEGIMKYLEKLTTCSYEDEDEAVESGQKLWKCPVARDGLQKMVDICIDIVDIFAFCEIDLFSGSSHGPTKTMQLVMSE